MQDSCIILTAQPIFSWPRNSMKLFSILCGASGSQKSKMAVLKEDFLISQHVYNIAANFQLQNSCFQGWGIQWRYSPILCDASGSDEIQNGGSQTGNTHISDCVHHYWRIPKATPMFPKSMNSKQLFPILCDVSGSRKSKMAALKEEIQIAQHIYNIVAKFMSL